jgi:leader peptidase (prepilin peptidase) / N-methyltransferase
VTARETAAVVPSVEARLGLKAAVAVAGGWLALLCLLRVGLNGEGVIAAFTAFVLVELAAIDLRERILPNRIVLPATAALVVAHAVLTPDRALECLLAAAAAGAALFLPALIRPGSLGMGDVKLAMLLGAALGRPVVPALTLGLFAAGLFALGLVLVRGRAAMKTEMPLGPFLAFGGLVLLLA